MTIVDPEYRNRQALKLQKLLKIYTDDPDNLSSESLSPIGSPENIVLINKLIESKNFMIIPVNSPDDQTTYTHFYTIGLWYFWNIPEIVIKYENSMKINPEIVNLVFDVIVNKILESNKNENQEFVTNIVKLNLERFNLECEMTLIKEDEYLDIQSVHLLWFYMFYAKARMNSDNQPIMFPVYLIHFDHNKYKLFEQKIIEKLIENVDQEDNDSFSDTE